MRSIGAFEAKTHFGELLDQAAAGDVILITRRGQPIARLVPHESEPDVRVNAERAVNDLRRLRSDLISRNAFATEDEIRSWRSEGRR